MVQVNVSAYVKDMPAKAKPKAKAKAKIMPARMPFDSERLAVIRKENVQRHVAHENRLALRDRIQRNQQNETLRLERDRLRAASTQGPLSQRVEKRLEDVVVAIARGHLSGDTLKQLKEIKELDV